VLIVDIVCYQEVAMPDILIRNISPEDLAMIDDNAVRLGISRSEYLRRTIEQEARRSKRKVTVQDLKDFAERYADLDDEEIMRGAWS
jgi:hypothetical protein